MKSDLEKILKAFKENRTPYYFVSPTNFNLIDIHNWVNKWTNINLIDCFDRKAPQCILPDGEVQRVFENLEEINEYLLRNEKIQNLIKDEKKGNIIYLFFNHELEKMAKQLGQKVILPPNDLVRKIDSKITTTEIGNKAGVLSVPNFLGKIESYQALMQQAQEYNLGESLVIQAPYGDSGKTTYFVSSEEDYNKYAEKIESQTQLKVMKKVNCIEGAIEGCATKKGTYVGMMLSELVGFAEFTPYKGGWCGNEVYQEQFSQDIRTQVHSKTEKIGDALYQEGYRGYFEVDYLVDIETKEIYLGEINPRLTGITAITNMSHFCQKYMPLFLFHLLEYKDEEIAIDPKVFNKYSLAEGAMGISSQLIVKATQDDILKIEKAPESGVYELKGEELILIEKGSNPAKKGDDSNHLYIQRILNTGEYTYKGADKYILFLNEKLTKNNGDDLTSFSRRLITALNRVFVERELTQEEKNLIKMFNSPASVKGNA